MSKEGFEIPKSQEFHNHHIPCLSSSQTLHEESIGNNEKRDENAHHDLGIDIDYETETETETQNHICKSKPDDSEAKTIPRNSLKR